MDASKMATSSGTRLLCISSPLIGSPSNAVVFCLVVGTLLGCDAIHSGVQATGMPICHFWCDDVVEGEGG